MGLRNGEGKHYFNMKIDFDALNQSFYHIYKRFNIYKNLKSTKGNVPTSQLPNGHGLGKNAMDPVVSRLLVAFQNDVLWNRKQTTIPIYI